MSHVTDLKLKVRDLDALEETLAERFPHLELRKNQKTHAWWGTFVGDSVPPPGRDPKKFGTCAHAIGRRGFAPKNGPGGEWEIGLVPALDGDGFDLLADSYGGAGRTITQDIPALKREYACTVATTRAKAKLTRKGWRVERQDLPGNKIRLKLRKR